MVEIEKEIKKEEKFNEKKSDSLSKIEKEIVKEEKQVGKFLHKKSNLVMSIIIAVLAIALILLLVLPKGMSASAAGKSLVENLNSRVGGGVTLINVSSVGSLYEVNVNYQDQVIPVYITKDGKYMAAGVQELTPADSQSKITGQTIDTPTEVPKSDKPKVELYIWGYCPYGVAAQGPLAEVAELLKGKVDFEVVLYYAGHGAFEAQQNKIQACIQKYAPSLYWKYAAGFVETIYPKCSSSRDIDCDKNESIKLMNSLGINSAMIMKYVDSEGESLVEEYSARAQANGVTGSPTLMINGVIVNVARNSEAYKTAICEAFNKAPTECSTALNADTAAANGNCG